MEKKGILDSAKFSQVALVVNDIEEARQKFADLFGVEVPSVGDGGPFEITGTKVMGEPAPLANCKLAFFDLVPGVQLELIEPNKEHSVWRDEIERLEEGLHHIAFQVEHIDDVAQQLVKEYDGVIEQEGLYGDGSGKYVYVSLHKTHHVRVELLESFR